MKSKSLVAASAVILLLACKPQEQHGTLAGIVKDQAGAALPAAIVTTTPATSTDTTDATGHYRMDYLPVGTYQLLAVAAGHVPVTQSAVVKGGETTQVDVTMNASLRTVSAEMIASDCHMGIANRMAMYALMDSIGDRISHVEYHGTSDTMGENWEAFLTPVGEERRLFYNPSFHMGGWLYPDGAVELKTSTDFRRVIDSMMAIPSPVQISLSGTSDGQAVDITVQLTGVDDIGTTSKLAMGITEHGPINFVNVMGGDTTYVRDVALNMTFTDNLSLAPGETKTFTAHLVIPDTLSPLAPPFHVVNKSDIGIFAIVQDMTTKQVHQSAKKEL